MAADPGAGAVLQANMAELRLVYVQSLVMMQLSKNAHHCRIEDRLLASGEPIGIGTDFGGGSGQRRQKAPPQLKTRDACCSTLQSLETNLSVSNYLIGASSIALLCP